MSRALPLLAIAIALAVAAPADAATFLVNTSDDTADAVLDGRCADARGRCSLRAAITEANQAPDFDTINFRSFMRIMLTDFLPAITSPVWINGHSARGAPPMTGNAPAAPVITLDGDRIPSIDVDVEPLSGPDAKGHGLHLFQGASGSLVQGLSIVNFQVFELVADGINDSIFTGLWVGVDVFGRAVDRPLRPESPGVGRTEAHFGGSNNHIGEFSFFGRTVGRGNVFQGLVAIGGDANHFARNRVGVSPAGDRELGSRSSLAVVGSDNVVGALEPPRSTRRNVISRMRLDGNRNLVVGSFIGRTLSFDTLVAWPGSFWIEGRDNQIGDGSRRGRNYIGQSVDETGERNTLLGNRIDGRISFNGRASSLLRNTVAGDVELISRGPFEVADNRIYGNYHGISVNRVEANITRNIIVDAEVGILAMGFPEVFLSITDNLIGTTSRSARTARGNSSTGVYLSGVTGEVSGNTIAHNRTGLVIDFDDQYSSLSGVLHYKNRFIANCGLGIDVRGEIGRDVNDPGDLGTIDLDQDPQNSPVILNTAFNPGSNPSVTLKYRVDNVNAREYPMTVEFHLSDSTKVNQGERSLAVVEYDPSRLGDVEILTVPLPRGIEGGALVALATPFEGLPSEFSYPVLFGRTDIVLDDSIDECELD